MNNLYYNRFSSYRELMLIGAEDMLTFSIIVLYVHGLVTDEMLTGIEDTLTGYR